MMRRISNRSCGRARRDNYLMRNSEHGALDKWSHHRRNRLEPIIRERFRTRGQTDDEACHYIEGVCWDHPSVAVARILSSRS